MRFNVLLIILALAMVRQANGEECYPTFVDCYCESSLGPKVQIPINTVMKMDKETGRTYCVADTYAPDVCMNRNCTIIPNENYMPLFGNMISFKSGQKQNSLVGKDDAETYMPGFMENIISRAKRFVNAGKQTLMGTDECTCPQEIIIAPRSSVHRRPKRRSRPCEIPTFDNSQLTCWKWPNWVTCNQHCSFGHGIDVDGETVTEILNINCRDSVGEWKPQPVLEDCKPFKNCIAHLKSPGELTCYPEMNQPSYCEIKCEEYDDLPSIEMTTYSCKHNLELPHCAELDDTVELIKPPTNVIEPETETEPEPTPVTPSTMKSPRKPKRKQRKPKTLSVPKH